MEVKDEDLEMSITQAKQYQAHLKSATINKRLLTEAQKREKAQIEKDKRLAVDSVMAPGYVSMYQRLICKLGDG